MADEINRTPPKTQSALLEAMQEGQATIDGVSHRLDDSFFVIATQNPIEFEGTYPLPEAQLDRFGTRIVMRLPDRAAEVEIYRRSVEGTLAGWARTRRCPERVVGRAEAAALRARPRGSSTSRRSCSTTSRRSRERCAAPNRVEIGVSPRGALALHRDGARGALAAGRDFVTFRTTSKRFLEPCWAHRTLLTAEAELESRTPAQTLAEIAAAVPVPR